jgi:hypothetical protein
MRQNRKGTDREYIVYGLTLNNVLFYIGKTSIILKDRLRVHKKNNKKIINYCKEQIDNLNIVVIEKCVNNLQLHERERYWIKYFNSLSNNLLNNFNCTNRHIPKKYLHL